MYIVEYGMHIEDRSDPWTFATLQTYMIEHEGWSGEADQQEIFFQARSNQEGSRPLTHAVPLKKRPNGAFFTLLIPTIVQWILWPPMAR